MREPRMGLFNSLYTTYYRACPGIVLAQRREGAKAGGKGTGCPQTSDEGVQKDPGALYDWLHGLLGA